MLAVKPITNKKVWQNFLEKKYTGFPPFFQSWNWIEVQKKLGFTATRLGLYENDELVGVVAAVLVLAKRGRYVHLRHGPVLLEQKKEWYDTLLGSVKEIAKESNCSFIRMSPLIEESESVHTLMQSLGAKNAPIHNMDAEVCWVLDITKPEDELLAQMRKSHRYLIKKALQEPIEILAFHTLTDEARSFLDIYKGLANKRHFVPHRGLLEEIEILGADNESLLLLAKYQGKIIGGAVIGFVGDMAIYHHGATDDEYRNLSVSHLLQWYAIREAKKRGKKLYNFWGIAPNESKKHPWYGLTLFKTGFGGEKKVFLHAKDLVLSPLYWKTYLIELVSKIRKGY